MAVALMSKGGALFVKGGALVSGDVGCVCCGPTCSCPSDTPCTDCPDLTPLGFNVTLAGVTGCAGCISCPDLGISFQFDSACDINGDYRLLQSDGDPCVWKGPAVCTGKLYTGATDCTGAFVSINIEIKMSRGGSDFFFGVSGSGGGFTVVLFSGTATSTNCCASFTVNNDSTGCGCFAPLGMATAVAAAYGGTANLSPDNTACVCPVDCSACATPTQCVIAGLTGTCATLNGTYALTRDPIDDPFGGGSCVWDYRGIVDGGLFIIDIRCDNPDHPGQWTITVEALSFGPGFAFSDQWVGVEPIKGPCPPLHAVACANTFDDGACPGVGLTATLS